MRLLVTLLAKDLRRAWRNPLPWLIHLAMPLLITALLGLAFGRSGGDGSGLGRLEFAIVDEDDSMVTGFLRGALNQDAARERLAPVFLDRPAALARLNEDRLSAVVIIPPHFTRDYLAGTNAVTLELVKNPARSIHPTVIEELLGVVVTGLNALSRNLAPEFPAWRTAFTEGLDHRQLAVLIERGGDRFESFRRHLDPLAIGYQKEAQTGTAPAGPAFNVFGYVLAGLATMFLLFLATHGMTSLLRELEGRTFERYHTLHQSLAPFLLAKLVFTVVMLLLGGAIMLGGGGLIFGIPWRQPGAIVLLVLAYATFAGGFMACFAALVPDVRRADALANVAAMALGLAGGCAFPPQGLPTFLREHLMPWLPTHWLAERLRELQSAPEPVAWLGTAAALLLLGTALTGVAAWLFRRRFAAGLRA